MKNLKTFYTIVLCLSCSVWLNAQTTLQVATKSIEKTMTYKKGYDITIDGEKADVVVQTGSNISIKIEVELSSKHPNMETAKHDLEAIKFVAEEIGKKIYVRNYVAIGKGENKPVSNLKAKYIITVPAECPVNLKNNFGKSSVSNLVNYFDLYSEFCSITLNNLKGTINIDTRFGDIDASQIDGKVNIKSKRTDITLSQLKGSYDLTANYGSLRINGDLSAINLKINGEKANVFFNPGNQPYNYALTSNNGALNIPKDNAFSFSQNDALKKMAYLKSNNTNAATVQINLNFGSFNYVTRP
jgi:hypothetical protein